MLSFKGYLIEAMSSDTKGKLHELLVGYHLNSGKHMEKHENADGESPQEAHDRLQKSVTPEDYKEANERAKTAAEDIKKNIKGPIHKVQWTSKAGDLHRATGIHASQTEDASDIVVTSKHPDTGKDIHHGVSLKVSDKHGEVPVSNPGMESTYGGKSILDSHREGIKKDFPEVMQPNKVARKEAMAKNPKAAAEIKKRNSTMLNNLAAHLHNHLSNMSGKELSDHIREHVLKAKATPMQQQGHVHMKHTTTGTSDFRTSTSDPSKDYENKLTDHENLSVERRGTSVVFSHKGVPFAKHRMKLESGSDPMSSVKGSGEIIKSKKQ